MKLWKTSSMIVLLAAVTIAQTPNRSIHPDFKLLDEDSVSVLQSGKALSLMKTCGTCHDTGYITGHSFHADVGLSEWGAVQDTANAARPWDKSPGWYGKWNPLVYESLSAAQNNHPQLGTADWIKMWGVRHVGGGPAERSRDGMTLDEKSYSADDAEMNSVDADGQWQRWDWQKSGTVEMNCLLCHVTSPNNQKRIEALREGNFEWASTATLSGSGIVQETASGWKWNSQAFEENGNVKSALLTPQDPGNDNCAQCHGLVHSAKNEPLIGAKCEPTHWSTITTGQVVSGQRIKDSGVNLAGKQELSRSWDIHAERLVECVDCHFSLNNPVYYRESDATRPEHLKFDARRLDIDDYLLRPNHQFAKGQSTQGSLAKQNDASMRRCESCHDATVTHDWLPYKERHFNAIACESCHIPKLYSPAKQNVDWTVLTATGEPASECRGADGDPADVRTLIEGYEPLLLARRELDGRVRITPYNLVSAWYWVHGDPAQPLPKRDLETVYLEEGSYRAEILTLLDDNGNGTLEKEELRLETAEEVDYIAAMLRSIGLENPRIAGEITPYGIHHNVTSGDWANRDCATCHSKDSRMDQPMVVANHVPPGAEATIYWAQNIELTGGLERDAEGRLIYRPNPREQGLYVLGNDAERWINRAGAGFLLIVLFGAITHGVLRIIASRRRPQNLSINETQKVYMYRAYERFWHWLQALAIIGLIFTGLAVHAPDTYGFVDFNLAVQIHNVLGFVLLANAFLAAFHHFTSGTIKQFIPEPRGFFSQAIEQTLFYLGGIFRGEKHPFEKEPRKKLNPLQKITYLIILNILLPLQIVSGVLIWGAQRWPEISSALGGLPFLVPLHSLVAWLFASFLILHIYLTTTGHTVFSNLKAMIVGWEKIEKTPATEEKSK